jgi:hypothetical protein
MSLQPRVYPPVGRCIYCGIKGGDLRREHIIAFGLGGNFILPQASCRNCERITGRIEQHCLKRMFGQFRNRAGLPTRRPKDRPKNLTLQILDSDEKYIEQELPAAEFPRMVSLPRFRKPGLLERRPPSEGMYIAGIHSAHAKGDLPPNVTVLVEKSFRIELFCAMLAKIGHAFAIAERGYDVTKEFSPLLPRLILNETMDEQLIGGSMELEPPEPSVEHKLRLVEHRDLGALSVEIRLFASYGSPIYCVVFGKRSIVA